MFVEINGNALDVELTGPEGAPLIIVHHGAPGLGSKAEPRASFGPLADTYRVLVFDARGSGNSEGKEPFTHEQWVADVEALREWAGAERFVMAGGSYGGFISMEYAVRHPERLLAMVLRDTSPDSSNEELARANALASARVELDLEKFGRIMDGAVRDDDDLRECWAEILPLYDHVYDPAVVARKVEQTPYRYRTHNYAFTHNMPAYDVTDRLGAVTCPTLVTVGRGDWITPVSCSERIVELIPGARLEVFEESGHSPQVEEAEKFQSIVRSFLREALERTAPA
ncbi:alpha/beta fold hydrolase [Phycicoccus duodecadis]|uniref:Proline iminopeptidase n=1 Tax=Phycicoccus duodecadis TaxID=173053 RepID=A0A2N3YLW7_9MICO|nr:alpha/beta hydrolase [Phycicoccus duodecadis]PKW27855.1 proline iminopeptidase [Phycicoccus duodecadis]